MQTVGNIIWHVPLLGFVQASLVYVIGLILCATVVGAPIGLGLMEYGKFLFSPFSKAMISKSELKVKQNIVWRIFSTIVRSGKSLDVDHFDPFVRFYMSRITKLQKMGFRTNASTALIVGFDWLQTRLKLSDRIMNHIVPGFSEQAGDFARVDRVAAQLNRAESER